MTIKYGKTRNNASNNLKMLKTSFGIQTKIFFEHSTLHGVRYIAENDRPLFEKLMWFGCVMTGAVASILIIVSLWEKFQTSPTITGLDTDFHNWNVPFPAITICQETPSNLTLVREYIRKYFSNLPANQTEMFLLKLSQISYETIQEFADFLEYSEEAVLFENIDIKNIIFGLMNKCEDIFDECVFKGTVYNCCDHIFPVFTENGYCYTFNSRHYEKKMPWREKELPDFNMHYIKETDTEWALKFKVTNNDIKMPIYIINSDESIGIDVQPQHVWNYKVNKISFSVKQTYTTEDTKQLTIKQRNCVFPNEIKLKIDHMYTYTACARQCRMETALETCKCVPHFYPNIGPYRHCFINELKCIAKNLNTIKKIDRCSCYLGCSNAVYEVEKLLEISEFAINDMKIEFVSWPMVRYKREVLFGWVDLLVSFGGIAGLFLGFSLLSAVEVLYYFTIRPICMLKMEKDVLIEKEFEKKSKAAIDYDLSLIPYFISEPYPGNGLNQVAKTYYYEHENKKRNKILPADHIGPRYTDMIPPFGIEFIN